MVKSLALNFWLNYIKMLKIVIIVSNTLGWNAKHTSLVQFHSVTPELAIISCQKYTQNPDTNSSFVFLAKLYRQRVLAFIKCH